VTTRSLARVGALAGVLSVIVYLMGMGLVGLPATAAGLPRYIASASAVQTGIGNFVELFATLLFLLFAALLYSVARDADPGSRSWPALAAMAGATVYVAVTSVEIATQQAIVEWGKAGADAKTTLGLYIFDESSYPLSVAFGGLFLAGMGVALLGAGGRLRLVAFSALAVAIVLFAGGLIGTAFRGNPWGIIAFVIFLLWTLIVGVYLAIRPGLASPRP
jgi:hypothetical protein